MDLINIEYDSIEPRMSRDFLVKFKNFKKCQKFEKTLLKINNINNDTFFLFDNRGKDIFVTLSYSKEIYDGFKIKIDENLIIDFSKHVNFVAIKNGEHSSKGYFYSRDLLENSENIDNFHVKEIFNIINNHFDK